MISMVEHDNNVMPYINHWDIAHTHTHTHVHAGPPDQDPEEVYYDITVRLLWCLDVHSSLTYKFDFNSEAL